jgi:hypothetical protein
VTFQPNLGLGRLIVDVSGSHEFLLLLLLSVGPAVHRLMYCSLPRPIVLTPLCSPLSSPESFHVRWGERPLSAKSGIMGEK